MTAVTSDINYYYKFISTQLKFSNNTQDKENKYITNYNPDFKKITLKIYNHIVLVIYNKFVQIPKNEMIIIKDEAFIPKFNISYKEPSKPKHYYDYYNWERN